MSNIQFPSPNRITKSTKDYYISYNYIDHRIYGSDTTAIVIGEQMNFFLILKGNHTKALNALDLKGSIEYFKMNIHLAHERFSDHEKYFALEKQSL